MKRVFSVVLVLLLLCGCKEKAGITPITKGITFLCEATYYNEFYECEGDVQKNGDMSVKFTAPADIEGLTFSFNKNGVSVDFKEIQYVSEKIIFENSVASLIHEVMSQNNTAVFEQDDVFFLEGVNNDFEYKLEIGATGLPIKITTRPDVAQITFKKVKIK